MGVILMTGATGFIGGSMAAMLLAQGGSVIAISRNDTQGDRTRKSINEAAEGFEIILDSSALERLRVINSGSADLTAMLETSILKDIDIVWHGAAEMTFLNGSLPQSFRTNVCSTAAFYKKIVAGAPKCKRFYYVSTAYTAGMGGGDVLEELHVSNPCINAYQTTKWCAEHALHYLQLQHGLPVTLFRPTMVVGHTKTGWTRRNGLGIYRYMDAIKMVSDAGGKEIRLNITERGHPDMIPIDRLVKDAANLIGRVEQGTEFEIAHCACGRTLSTRQLTLLGGDIMGVSVSFGPAQSDSDRTAHNLIKWLLPFGNEDWNFDRSRLDLALGYKYQPITFNADQLKRLVGWYCQLSI